tara:strand:- start:62570 stop:63088 length:519 start_codon:yes stop_codon:yes gene_type:complete
MEKLNIKGKHPHASKVAIRAWIHASHTILSFHNLPFDLYEWRFEILDLSKKTNSLGRGVGGVCSFRKKRIRLSTHAGRTLSHLGTIILHECIHAALGHIEQSEELIVSTLTARLKPDVAAMAQILIDGTYKRAAYLAHRQKGMGYPDEKPDRYNKEQWEIADGVKDKYHKRR